VSGSDHCDTPPPQDVLIVTEPRAANSVNAELPEIEASRSFNIRTALLILAPLLAFASSIPGEFVWLDHSEIEQGGYRVRNPSEFARIWAEPLDRYVFRDVGEIHTTGGYWRPLYALSISFDWVIWGPRTEWYHAENLVWHIIVVLLLYRLGIHFVGDTQQGRFAAFWAALLFSVHPMNIQSVTWISGRKDVQCACLGIACVLAFFSIGRARPVRGSLICIVTFVLALGFKELAAVVPLYLTIWMLKSPRDDTDLTSSQISQLQLKTLAVMWCGTVAWFVWRAHITGAWGLNAERFSATGPDHAATLARLWVHYAACVLQPIPSHLSDRWFLTPALSVSGIVSLLIVAMATTLTIRGIVRRNALSAGWWWFLIWLFPASGIVPLRHMHAERYLYPAGWGLLLFSVSRVCRELEDHQRLRRILKWGFLGLAGVWGTVTSFENIAWHNDQSLFQLAVDRDPDYVEGRLALAHWYLGQEDDQRAADESRRAIETASNAASPGYWSPVIAHTNYGLALYHLGKHQQALDQFSQAAVFQPDAAVIRYHRGLAALAVGQLDQAEHDFRFAFLARPDDALAGSNLAYTLLRKGDAKGCLRILLPLLEQDPDNLLNRRNAGTALLLVGRFPEALIHCTYVVDHGPSDPGDIARLAWAHWGTGDFEQAQTVLDAAIRESPEHPTVDYVRGLISSNRP
jgi:protein O-mannosyl-transferase